MSSELDTLIEDNVTWEDLPLHIRSSLGGSPSQFEAAVVEYSYKHQLRWKSNRVRNYVKDERAYYETMLARGREDLLLFPYHLSVQVIQRLKITPFKYYHSILYELMMSEKSYDTLPNFTAIDCLRTTDVGRNQYIDFMNTSRAKKFFRSRKIRDSLPSHPAQLSHYEGWWVVHLGYITEEEVKNSTTTEHKLIDKLIDGGPTAACNLDPDVIASLYTKDLIYFEIPVLESDRISFPPLEGFVMNRLQGDVIETLLYKIFLSANDDTSIDELSTILQTNSKFVRQAVSLFIRFGLAKKKNPTLPSDGAKSDLTVTHSESSDFLLVDLNAKESLLSDSTMDDSKDSEEASRPKRLGFLYDSSLTAYLMMGNLSPGLKTHAVTMFEVGKLSDENIDSFLNELAQISFLSEGEAQRYFDHAHALFNTLTILRGSSDTNKPLPMDLLRAESIAQLDSEACQRLLCKNYNALVSMAPLNCEAAIPSLPEGPPLMGPPSQSCSSVWFKLWLYEQLEHGPPSLLLTRGTRLQTLPAMFRAFSEVLCETWGHDPSILSTNTILQVINDTLTHTPVFLQGYSTGADTVTKNIPLPMRVEDMTSLDPSLQSILQKLGQLFDLTLSCGYITLLKIGPSRLPNFFYNFGSNDYSMSSIPTDITDMTQSQNRTSLPLLEETIVVPTVQDTPEVLIDVSPHRNPPESPTTPSKLTSAQSMAENFLKELDDLKLFEESQVPDSASDAISLDQEPDTKSIEIPTRVVSKAVPGANVFSDWVLLDVSFGVPLFDVELNKKVCYSMLKSNSLDHDNLMRNLVQTKRLAIDLKGFIDKCQQQHSNVQSWSLCSRSVLPINHVPHPTRCIAFSDSILSFFTT